MGGIQAGLLLLREGDFPKLFGAHLVSWFGTSMAPIAMAFGVLELTGSTRDTGFVVASQTGAQVLALLFGGVVADRLSRRRVMIGADLVAMAAQSAMASALVGGWATTSMLMALMAVNGAALAFHSPALMGFIPEVVPRDKLQPANALLGTARSGAMSLGAATAGVLVAAYGAGFAVLVNALTFAVSAALASRISVVVHAPRRRTGVLGDLRDGFAEFSAHRWLWIIVLQFSLVVAGVQSVYGLVGPVVARANLGGASDWGLIAAAMGVGTLIGGFVALRVTVERTMLVATNCVFLFALPALLLASTQSVGLIAFGAFVNGIAGQVFGVLWVTTLHRKVAPGLLSRVSAYDNLGSIALAPAALIGAGSLLEAVGATLTLSIAAAMVIVPTALALLDRDVRTLRLD